jgi:protein-S-isoprenylcysteine O-methyltransferase
MTKRRESILISSFSFVLGVIFGGSLVILLNYIRGDIIELSLFLILLAVFHYLEFFFSAFYQSSFSADDFLLDNGWEYPVFVLLSFCEHFHKLLPFPRLVHQLGVVFAIVGQIIRSMAMIHGKEQFSHRLQNKAAYSKLVTSGIYSLIRHPSYFGFFLWAIGLEIVLENLICLVLVFIFLTKFFRMRIKVEEEELIRFFGGTYLEYKNKVFSGVL